MNLIYVPIQPLEERYSAQWYKNFPTEFKHAGFNVTVIDGVGLHDIVKVGAFLDINSCIHYQSTQMAKIASLFDRKLVPQGTTFFFGDLEFWGLESLRLMADLNGVKISITGFLHAASYTIEDAFSVASPYQKYTELGWFSCIDKIFVGSNYHKNAVITRRLNLLPPKESKVLAEKIIVTGNPLFREDYPSFDLPKENIVLLTNRFDSEKRPGLTLRLFEIAKERHPDWRFIVTTGRPTLRSNSQDLVDYALNLEAKGVIEVYAGLDKTQYHEFLAKAKVMVSHSIEENFGYCIAEAMVYTVAPFLRNGLSHVELVQGSGKNLFDSDLSLSGLEYLMNDTSGNYAEMIAPYFYKPMQMIIKGIKC